MLGGPGSARQNVRVGSGSVLASRTAGRQRDPHSGHAHLARETVALLARAVDLRAVLPGENYALQPADLDRDCLHSKGERQTSAPARAQDFGVSAYVFFAAATMFLVAAGRLLRPAVLLARTVLGPNARLLRTAARATPRTMITSHCILAPGTLEVVQISEFLGGIHFQEITPGVCAFEVCLLYVQGPVNLGVGKLYTARAPARPAQCAQHQPPVQTARSHRSCKAIGVAFL